MATVVELVEEQFGTLSNRLANKIERGKVPWSELCDFGDRFREYYEAQQIESAGSNKLRPYIPVQELRSPLFSGGLDLAPQVFYEGAEAPLGSLEAVKQHLLYCHSLAVDNPLAYFTDFMWPETDEVPRERLGLANYLRFLTAIRPLVDDGVLILVEPHFRDSGLFPNLRTITEPDYARIGEAIETTGDFSDLVDAAGNATPDPDARTREFLAYHVATSILVSLAAAEHHHLDLYTPFRFFISGLEAMAAPLRDDAVEIRELLSIDLPRLSSLKLTDLVALRRDEEAFAYWRQQVEEVLAHLEGKLQHGDSPANDELLTEASARLFEGRHVVEQQIEKSSVLTQLKAGTRNLGIGAVVATALLPAGVPFAAGAMATAAGKEMAELIWRVAKGKKNSGTAALHRHFLLFRPGATGR